jgi:hypothetical protein
MRTTTIGLLRRKKADLALSGIMFIAICSVSSSSLGQSPPEQARPLIRPEAYERILDEVFSHEEPKATQLQYSLVLRFMSSRHTESEVTIFVFKNGSVQANLYRVSGQSAWNVANDATQRTGSTDTSQIAKMIQTTKQDIAASPDQAALWYSGLQKSIEQSTRQLQQELASFGRTGETTIFLDGSTYELWFQQGLTQFHWIIMDEEVDDVNPAGHAPLARWMNEVRRHALRHVGK